MKGRRDFTDVGATELLPQPAEFPLGSARSRAAARTKVEALKRTGMNCPPRPNNYKEWLRMVQEGVATPEYEEWHLRTYGVSYRDWWKEDQKAKANEKSFST